MAIVHPGHSHAKVRRRRRNQVMALLNPYGVRTHAFHKSWLLNKLAWKLTTHNAVRELRHMSYISAGAGVFLGPVIWYFSWRTENLAVVMLVVALITLTVPVLLTACWRLLRHLSYEIWRRLEHTCERC